METELLRSKTELMLLNNQLLEAVQKRLELSLELEAWKVKNKTSAEPIFQLRGADANLCTHWASEECVRPLTLQLTAQNTKYDWNLTNASGTFVCRLCRCMCAWSPTFKRDFFLPRESARSTSRVIH